MTYTIEKITALIGAHRYGSSDANIEFLLTDSRSMCFPEETLFFALKTKKNDGHHYIPDLYRRGVRNFVVEQVPADWSTAYSKANFLKVVDSLKALQRLAERHRDSFDIPIVGITGSNGKTVVKEWLYQLLSPSMAVTRSPRSYNSQIGVPLSVWLLNEQTQVGLFEAGISMPGEMLALRDIIQPTIAVLTNFTPQPYGQYRIGLPYDCELTEIFNTDQPEFCGSGQGNPHPIRAEKVPHENLPYSCLVYAPPLATVYFKVNRAVKKRQK